MKQYFERFIKDFKRCWMLHLFMLTGTAFILIFSYYPMLGIQIGFKNFDLVGGMWHSPWVGLRHFDVFVHSSDFWLVIKNTLKISLYSMAVGFPLPIIFALQLNIMRAPGIKKTVQTITYMPHFVSVVVLVGMMNQLLSPVVGLYGSLYRIFTDGIYPPDILGNSKAFIHMYVWSGVWQSLGWDSILYLAALSGVSPELHEAAMLDGANRFSRIIHVDLPSIMPTIIIMLILRSGSILGVGYEKVYLMQNSMNTLASEVISTYVYKQGLGRGVRGFSYGSAVGTFNSIINFIMLVIVNGISKRLSDDETSLF